MADRRLPQKRNQDFLDATSSESEVENTPPKRWRPDNMKKKSKLMRQLTPGSRAWKKRNAALLRATGCNRSFSVSNCSSTSKCKSRKLQASASMFSQIEDSNRGPDTMPEGPQHVVNDVFDSQDLNNSPEKMRRILQASRSRFSESNDSPVSIRCPERRSRNLPASASRFSESQDSNQGPDTMPEGPQHVGNDVFDSQDLNNSPEKMRRILQASRSRFSESNDSPVSIRCPERRSRNVPASASMFSVTENSEQAINVTVMEHGEPLSDISLFSDTSEKDTVDDSDREADLDIPDNVFNMYNTSDDEENDPLTPHNNHDVAVVPEVQNPDESNAASEEVDEYEDNGDDSNKLVILCK